MQRLLIHFSFVCFKSQRGAIVCVIVCKPSNHQKLSRMLALPQLDPHAKFGQNLCNPNM